MKKYILFFVGGFLLLNCSPSVEDYIGKAKVALEKEDNKKAEFFFNLAYERSINDDFFPVERKRKFAKISRTVDGSKVFLLAKHKQFFNKIFVYDLANDDLDTINLNKVVTRFTSSPSGLFLILTVVTDLKEKHCSLVLYNVINSIIEKIPNSTLYNCNSTAAIDDKGNALFEKKGNLSFYQRSKQHVIQKFTGKKIDSILSKIDEKSNILNISKELFALTYGNAGIYKAYVIYNGELVLLSKNVTASRIVTFVNKQKFGFFQGGAGVKKIVFYGYKNRKGNKRSVAYRDKVNGKLDFDYFDEKNYFFSADKVLYKVEDLKEVELPFTALALVATQNNEVYFLSRIGTFMHYGHEKIPKSSLPLYKKVQDFLE